VKKGKVVLTWRELAMVASMHGAVTGQASLELRHVVLRCESESPSFDQSLRHVLVTREDAAAWWGFSFDAGDWPLEGELTLEGILARNLLPSLAEFPKYAWRVDSYGKTYAWPSDA
jgi:hypothetical protein